MAWNDRIDIELHDLVSDAVDKGHLDETSPGYGIAQQVIDRGYDSLTDKQKRVFDGPVARALKALQDDRDTAHRRELLDRDDYVGFATKP